MNEGMVCVNCGKNLGLEPDSNCCKSCLIKPVVKEMFSTSIGPLTLVGFTLLVAAWPASAIARQELLGISWFWATIFVAGIPFGMKKMSMFIVPHGHDLAGTIGIVALNFIVGGLIGMFVLAWRVICAMGNLVKSGITLIHIARISA